MARNGNITVEVGDTLRAERTGKTYEVLKVTVSKVHVRGLPPVPRHELVEDIKNGKITQL